MNLNYHTQLKNRTVEIRIKKIQKLKTEEY